MAQFGLKFIQQAIRSRQVCTVVASMGRSGSTVAYQAFTRTANWRFLPRSAKAASGFRPNLASAPLLPGSVLKTHDLPEGLSGCTCDVRVLFCFGSAVESVLSFQNQVKSKGAAWGERHLINMKATGPANEILNRDILGLETQIDAWSTFEGHPTLCVHYDALWSAQAQISDFIGRPFRLPPKIQRRSRKSVDPVVLEKATATYGTLDERIASLPAFFEASGTMAKSARQV